MVYADTHNSFLWVMTETGAAGAFSFFAGLYLCFRSAWRSRLGPRGVLPLALLICVLVINSANTAINIKYTWLVFAYALASNPVRHAARASGRLNVGYGVRKLVGPFRGRGLRI